MFYVLYNVLGALTAADVVCAYGAIVNERSHGKAVGLRLLAVLHLSGAVWNGKESEREKEFVNFLLIT